VPVGEDVLRSRLADLDDEQRPLWYPEDQIPQAGIDSSAALAAGLRFRSAEDTARDALGQAGQEAGLDTPAFAARERTLREAG
jgi:2'-hydroxyisoflavone reductase